MAFEEGPRPREVLGRRGFLIGVLVLALNDHVLKSACPGVVTGKLSDIAGLFVLPLVMWAAIERGLAWCAVASAIAFAALKIATPVREAWIALHAMAGVPAQVVADSTDLLCIPMVGVAWAYGRAHLRAEPPAPLMPRMQIALRAVVLGAFVVLTSATSMIDPRPEGPHVYEAEGDLQVRLDQRVYRDKPFEVTLPKGPWTGVRLVERTRVPESDPSAIVVEDLTLLDLAPDDPSLQGDPVVLTLPIGEGHGWYLLLATHEDGRIAKVRFSIEPEPWRTQ